MTTDRFHEMPCYFVPTSQSLHCYPWLQMVRDCI